MKRYVFWNYTEGERKRFNIHLLCGCSSSTILARSENVLLYEATAMSKKHQVLSSSQPIKTRRIPNERLKAQRLKKNWTQVYVATMIGTSDVEVSRWETGVSIQSLYFRERLCELFGASPQELGFVASSETRQMEAAAAQHPSHRRDPLTSLLATKLYVPRPRTHLVPRSHL